MSKEFITDILSLYYMDVLRSLKEQGADTIIGSGGVRLSGGQAQRIALARTLCHKKPVFILDDPFSALDKNTEEQIYNNLRKMTEGSIVIILSHRLYMFPKLDKVIWLDEIIVSSSTHICKRVNKINNKPCGGKDLNTFKKLQDYVFNEFYDYTNANRID